MDSPKRKAPTDKVKPGDALVALAEIVKVGEGANMRGVAFLHLLILLDATGLFPRMSKYWRCVLDKARGPYAPKKFDEFPDYGRLLEQDFVSLNASGQLGKEAASPDLLSKLRCCVIPPEVTKKAREDLIEAWPFAQMLAQLESQYRSGGLLEMAAEERLRLAASALLLFGFGKEGRKILERICRGTIWRFAQRSTHNDRATFVAEAMAGIWQRRDKWSIAKAKGLGSPVRWVQTCVSRPIIDAALQNKLNPEVTSDMEDPTVTSATDANAAKNAIEDAHIRRLDSHVDNQLEGEMPATLAWPDPGRTGPKSASSARRYKKAGVDLDNPAAIAEEFDRRRHRRVDGYLTGREMATCLGIPESSWRTLRKKAESEGWKPAAPINGKTLFRVPQDVSYFKGLRAKMRNR